MAPMIPAPSTSRDSDSYLFLNPQQLVVIGANLNPSSNNMMCRRLKFPTRMADSDINGTIQLPPIHPYLPPGTDIDAANGLSALFRTHCIAVIDAFRYCKEKVLYHTFTAFHGILTVPIQKLLAHPSLANWIKACDWTMYQKIGAYASSIALTVIPEKVFPFFQRLTHKLSQHIFDTFSHLPVHVRDARHGPAVMFCSLLDRCLRVNATAHAAANLLESKEKTDMMWVDWATFVQPSSVVQTTLRGVGCTRTLQILTTEIRELLNPSNGGFFDGMQPLFHNALGSRGIIATQFPVLPGQGGIFDRWQRFIEALPTLFPLLDARTLIDYVSQVGAAAIRDLTIANAQSFGTWWVTKTFIDEMLLWQAEKGGFFEHPPASTFIMRPQKRTARDAGFDDDYDAGSRDRQAPNATFDTSHFSGHSTVQPAFSNQSNTAGPVQGFNGGHRNAPNQPPFYATEMANHAFAQQRSQTYSGPVTEYQNNTHQTHQPGYQSYDGATDLDTSDLRTPHDDSGIGMEADASPGKSGALGRSANYDAFVGHAGTGSDPADVVVC